MKLPNAENAFVDIDKLRNYCLSMEHPRGRNKARVFASQLGLGPDDAEQLRSKILTAILVESSREGDGDEFGQRYTVDFQMTGPTKNVTIRTAWMVRTGEDFPRLTSCYIL